MIDFTTPSAQQTIQAILTPMLMISACGLLLLGLNNRFSTVVNRIRSLNDEKRRTLADPDAIDRDYIDAIRFESVMRQIPSLLVRASHLRRALMALWVGVLCALFTSVCLAASLFLAHELALAAVVIFLAGIVAASVGVIHALIDIALAFKVLTLEAEIY